MKIVTGGAGKGKPETPTAETGRKDGQARAKALTPEQRAEVARKGAASRWGDTATSDRGFTLKVARTGRAPLPWMWEIVSESGKAGARRSARAYQSAEDAWAAGRAALADLRRGDDPVR